MRRNPCYISYKALEECLVETDRNFKQCQPQILALQACNNAANKKK
jgi:hypothetical protein